MELHLDPARKAEPFTGAPRIRTLHGQPGTTPERFETPMEWVSPDLLQATIPIAGTETVLNTVEVPGLNPVTLPPVCLPYSPEFAPDQPGRGAAALAQLAAATGGRERIQLPGIWAELPVQKRFVELTPWLLLSAVLVFLVEVLERRTGLVLAGAQRLTGKLARARLRRKPVATSQIEVQPAEAQPTRAGRTGPRPAMATTPPTHPRPAAEPARADTPTHAQPDTARASAQSTLEALREARERARRRVQ